METSSQSSNIQVLRKEVQHHFLEILIFFFLTKQGEKTALRLGDTDLWADGLTTDPLEWGGSGLEAGAGVEQRCLSA